MTSPTEPSFFAVAELWPDMDPVGFFVCASFQEDGDLRLSVSDRLVHLKPTAVAALHEHLSTLLAQS